MSLLKPDEFSEQFTDAARKADGQVVEEGPLLILKCVDHGLQLLPPEGSAEPILGCPEPGCQVWVRVEVEGT